MQFNQATDYAFRVVLHLAALPHGAIVNGQTLADKERIPQRFLHKIMRTLTAAGIIRSHRGADGGFALEKQAQDISLLTVVQAMEGPVMIQRCLGDGSLCSKACATACPVHAALGGVQEQLVASLGTIRFAELALHIQAGGGRPQQVAASC